MITKLNNENTITQTTTLDKEDNYNILQRPSLQIKNSG